MTLWTLIRRGLRFHGRAHLGVALGVAVGSAALSGALVLGDSVRGSLRDAALERLAGASLALNAQDRFFQANLFERLLSAVGSPPTSSDPWKGAPLLQLPAIASRQDGSARANSIQIFGVDDRFLGSQVSLGSGTALLNETLARQLHARPGDELILRVHKPSALSRDAAISPRADTGVAMRFKVAGIAPAERADLNLQGSATKPGNAFVRLEELGQALGLEGRANVMLLGSGYAQDAAKLQAALATAWQLGDAETTLTIASNRQQFELRTRRVFLDPALTTAALNADTNCQPALTFLANLIRAGTNATPYSMIAAAGPPWTPRDLRDDEIILSRWLAEDLKTGPGDQVFVSAFDPESGAGLLERTNSFRVRMIVPLEPPWNDRTLMPDFPGIEKAESTQDWDAGFPLVYKIRPQDEAYWKQFKGTPKAFVTLRAGQKIWANRFGDVTAIRFPLADAADPERARSNLERRIIGATDPASIGLHIESVQHAALSGADQSQDFGQLFIGFSAFLIAAALLLMALLFQFSLEQRATEIGTLLAVGFRPARVRLILLGEGTALAMAGGVAGALTGLGYARLMLWGLATIWRDAVGSSSLRLHANNGTLVLGVFISLFLAVSAIWLTLRHQAKQPAKTLLAGDTEPVASRSRGWALWIALAAGAASAGTVGFAIVNHRTSDAESFFSAGALLLIAGIAGASAWFASVASKPSDARLSFIALGVRGCIRRRKRSLASLALLGSGAFLILSIGVFRLDADAGASSRHSGTGGFALIGHSTLPISQDLSSRGGRESLGVPSNALTNVGIVPLRVHAGDEASCLNLNRAQKPRLLGVKPERLSDRFTFAQVEKGLDLRAGWSLLDHAGPENEIRAIGDANSIQWALGKKLGDTLDYADASGRSFKIRLVGAVANSILQGNLIISESDFVRLFPGESGYRIFLLDVPPDSVTQVSSDLSRALQDMGLELTSATQRLNEFNAVQNTYLGTFQVLGGLGLLLGSAGLGIVVLRNVRERRGELGLMLALGFRRKELHRLVLAEHGALLALGLGLGALAAAVAVVPAFLAPGAGLPYASLGLTLLAVWFNGLVWTGLAVRQALRGNLLASLRNE